MYYYVSSVLYWCNEYIKDLILGVPNFNYAGGKFMLRLPAIFSNHMVFQREKNILLWGESDAQSVTAVIGDNKYGCKRRKMGNRASTDGSRWTI